jgi:DNA invertase Pin-like site-specific DNA recombinase
MRSILSEISGNRRPNTELSESTRSAIFYAVENGGKTAEIARYFNIARSTVYDTVKRVKKHQTFAISSPWPATKVE